MEAAVSRSLVARGVVKDPMPKLLMMQNFQQVNCRTSLQAPASSKLASQRQQKCLVLMSARYLSKPRFTSTDLPDSHLQTSFDN